MLKRQYLEQLRHVMAQAHGEFETFHFDGKSCELADVLDELRSFSLMQQYKIVQVDDAEQFVSEHRDALDRYADGPVDHATLVLRSQRWNRGNLDKKIQKTGAIIKCDSMNPSQARAWIVDRCRHEHQRPMNARAADILVQRLGTNLSRLDAELSKLVLLVGSDEKIDETVIRKIIGRGSEEEAWAIQEALLRALTATPGRGQDAVAARGRQIIEKVHELVELAGQPNLLVVYFVADLMRKLHLGLMMKEQGVPRSVMARQLRLFGPRQTLFEKLLDRLDPARSARLFDAVILADRRAKSGLGAPMRNLERFCVELAGAVR